MADGGILCDLGSHCLEGTERAMTAEHAFSAAELCLRAQEQAVRVEG